MKLLAIDTATENCSVCYFDQDAGIRDELTELAPRRHAELLLPMVDTLVQRHALVLSQLDAICYARGPGSFTGVRIAAAAAQGLALGAGCQVRGVSTLQTLAAAAGGLEDGLYVSAIDARMSEVYLAVWQTSQARMSARIAECVLTPAAAVQRVAPLLEEAAHIGYAGSGIELLAAAGLQGKIPKNYVKFPSAGTIIDLVAVTFDRGLLCDPQEAVPVYIRDEVVGQPGATGLQKSLNHHPSSGKQVL